MDKLLQEIHFVAITKYLNSDQEPKAIIHSQLLKLSKDWRFKYILCVRLKELFIELMVYTKDSNIQRLLSKTEEIAYTNLIYHEPLLKRVYIELIHNIKHIEDQNIVKQWKVINRDIMFKINVWIQDVIDVDPKLSLQVSDYVYQLHTII